MKEPLVLYAVADRIATISLNRAEKRNALNPEMINLLTASLLKAAADDSVKIVILRANGKAFSAGADLAYLQELQTYTYQENFADSENLKNLFTTLYFLPKLIIAQVEGHAIAGGCGLATVCDFVFSIPEAQFGYTEVKLGFVPAIVSCFLLRKTSETIAKQLLFTAELFDAQQALDYGLINFISSKENISQETRDFALNLCKNTSVNSLKVTKQLIDQVNNPGLEKSLELAVEINAKVRESDDFKKGIAKFLSKQEFNW